MPWAYSEEKSDRIAQHGVVLRRTVMVSACAESVYATSFFRRSQHRISLSMDPLNTLSEPSEKTTEVTWNLCAKVCWLPLTRRSQRRTVESSDPDTIRGGPLRT